VLNVATQTVYRIAKGWFGLPDWSPDGKRLIVTAPSEPVGATDYPAYQPALYIIDLDNFLTRFNSK
jgi:Tol biopolymer transport system component